MLVFMKKKAVYFVVGLCSLILFTSLNYEEWGFFGHRRINRMAVFTLPQDMIGFFKKNIEFITEHAVDPDKRRYATKHEAVRHFIDIDHWGEYPFPEVPRDWTQALIKYTDLYVLTPQGDSILIFGDSLFQMDYPAFKLKDPEMARQVGFSQLPGDEYRKFFITKVMPQYYEEEWTLDCEEISEWLGYNLADFNCNKIIAVDRFSAYGILPYHLVQMQKRMTAAFENKNEAQILRLCTEMGHYIGDGSVPLHTTENYNGQLTNQVGIHAFWESRLPELFADQQYDFFVGKATYIEDPKAFFWDLVLESHSLLDSVLLIEKELSQSFPKDKQYCYEERLDITVRTQCKEYARAYHERMQGMVEKRMTDAIHAIGSAWFTAWVDAGQPDLDDLDQYQLNKRDIKQLKELEDLFKGGAIKGRAH